MLSGRKIILAITGSIAAYKAAFLVRLLVKNNAEVKVITTDAARQFVGDLTFSNLSQHPVFGDLWSGDWTEHVHLGAWADLMVVAPATANSLAKMANGICDNALTAVYLSAKCPVMVAPAMDADMYAHPSTHRNLALLEKDGVRIIPSGTGFLASGLTGPGRMAEPEAILEAVDQFFNHRPLRGKKVLVTAGPTRESIDPVRFISNHSSGKMGYAIALEAHRLGAEVTLISGPVPSPIETPFPPLRINSAQELHDEVMKVAADQDIIIMTAAVADYTPVQTADKKIKKKEGDMSIPLKRTPDILKGLGQVKPAGQTLVGFALETDSELENAKKKLASKNLDFIVLNSLREKGAGFGHDTNKITILDKNGEIIRYELKPKAEVAKDIFNKILSDPEYEKSPA